MKCLGRHLLVEYYSCNPKILMDVSRIEDLLVGAAKYAKAHIVDVVFHTFNPHGVSGVVVVEESHLAIHTWPEYGMLTYDIFTCSGRAAAERTIALLIARIKPTNVRQQEFPV